MHESSSFSSSSYSCSFSPYIYFTLMSMPEKVMAPHSSTLAWKIQWTEEPGRLQSTGSLRVRHDWATSLSCIGEGNGNPLQCSCLENPRDGGAWWAAICGVTQSQTPLKWLSSSNNEYEMVSHCILTCFLLMTGDVEHLFMYLAVICPPLEKYLFKYFAHQCIGYFVGFFVVVEL